MVCRMYVLKNFGNIKKSDLGIFIGHKNNLGHEGGCVGNIIHATNTPMKMGVLLMIRQFIIKSVFMMIFLFMTMR